MRLLPHWLTRSCCALAVAACASPGTPSPAPAPSAAPARPDSAAAPPATSTWAPRRAPGTWRYEVRTEAIVGLTGDTAAQQVPVRSTALYTLTLTPAGDRFSIAGRVDSATVAAGSQVPPAPHADSAPPAFRGALLPDGTIVALEGSTPAACAGGTEPAIAAVQSLVVRMPTTLTVGTTWRDTVTTVTCRGDLPLTTTTVRDYRAVGRTTWNGRPALEIERLATMALSSADSGASTRRMSVSGTGTATATLQVDPTTGLLLQGKSQHHATLTITTGRSTLPFQQDATELVTLRP